MIDKKKIGDRLVKIANSYFDGNKSDLARYLGKEPNSFYKYYSGNRTPGLDIVAKLGELGVNIFWFITGRGEMETTRVTIQGSNLADEMAEEFGKGDSNGKKGQQAEKYVNDLYSAFEGDELNPAEAELLGELKEFSLFLETRPLSPQVKRLLLQLLIQSIDQELERRQRAQAQSSED